jgi:hypothetical protein
LPTDKVEGAAVGSVGLSVLAVALITVVWPFVMGGSIALALAFGEEVEAANSPDDFNGFSWVETGVCSPLTGTYSTVSIDSYGQGKNWTSIIQPYDGTSLTNCNNNRSAVFELRIPQGLVDLNDTLSKFQFEHRSTTYATSGISGEWFFDWSLEVNGTAVIEVNDFNSNAVFTKSSTMLYWRFGLSHDLNGIEHLNLKDELSKCAESCVVSLVFTDIREGTHDGADLQTEQAPFKVGKYAITSYTTDAATEGLIMTLSPWIITILTLAVAIGSTRLWNPLVGVLSSP